MGRTGSGDPALHQRAGSRKLSRLFREGRAILGRRLAQDALALYGGNLTSLGFQVLLAIFLARALGPEGYGVIGLVISVTATVSVLLEVRIGETVIKYTTDYRVKGSPSEALAIIRLGYLIDLSLGVAAFVILFAVAPLAAQTMMHRPDGAALLRVYALIPLMATINETSGALLSVFQRFRLMSLLQTGGAVMHFALPLAGVAFGLQGVIVGYVLAELLPTLAYSTIAWRMMGQHFAGVKAASLRRQGREIFTFSLHTTLSTSFKSLVRYLDVLILGYFRTPAEVGYYRIALAGGGLLGAMAPPVTTSLYPRLSQRWASGQWATVKGLLLRISSGMAALSVVGGLALSGLASWALPLLVGRDFEPALPAFFILVWGVAANNIICWSRPFALASGRPQLSTWANILGAVLIAGVNLALVPGLGAVGAAWAYLATSLVMAAYYGFFLTRT